MKCLWVIKNKLRMDAEAAISRYCRCFYNLSAAADVSAAFLDVPREDYSAKLSKNLASALKMECNSEVDIKPSYQHDHKGEDVMFLWKMLMLHLWVRDRVWDPGIFTLKGRQI